MPTYPVTFSASVEIPDAPSAPATGGPEWLYLEDFGTVGQGDDTAAFQGALNEARIQGTAKIVLDRPRYDIGPLDATELNYVEIEAKLATIIRSKHQTSAPMLDLTNSHAIKLTNGVWQAPGSTTPAGEAIPSCAILTSGGDKITLVNTQTSGYFSSGALVNIGTASVNLDKCQLMNYHPSAPTLICSTYPVWNISSLFKTLQSFPNCPDLNVIASEIHSLGNAQWTCFLSGVDNAIFLGGINSNSNLAHFYLAGSCKRITAIGQKYYKEIGDGTADYVFQVDTGASVDHLKLLNCTNYHGQAFTGGAGSITNLWIG